MSLGPAVDRRVPWAGRSVHGRPTVCQLMALLSGQLGPLASHTADRGSADSNKVQKKVPDPSVAVSVTVKVLFPPF